LAFRTLRALGDLPRIARYRPLARTHAPPVHPPKSGPSHASLDGIQAIGGYTFPALVSISLCNTNLRLYLAKNRSGPRRKAAGIAIFTVVLLVAGSGGALAQFAAHDPGVRGGNVDSGQPLSSISQTPGASEFFINGQNRFNAIDAVSGQPTNIGLGPRFNSNQCSSCHAQPAS